jgi:Sec-independent protein translocase protein TatA
MPELIIIMVIILIIFGAGKLPEIENKKPETVAVKEAS